MTLLEVYYVIRSSIARLDVKTKNIMRNWINRKYMIVVFSAVIIVFIISIVASKIYMKIWEQLERKYNISDKICYKLIKDKNYIIK